MGLSAGTLFASMVGLACAGEFILDQAIDDYTGTSSGVFNDSPSVSGGVNRTTSILEEAYHDYDGVAVQAYNESLQSLDKLEQIDMGAFEEVPSVILWE